MQVCSKASRDVYISMCWMCHLYGARILSGCWVWKGARGDEDHDSARVCCFPSKVITTLWCC